MANQHHRVFGSLFFLFHQGKLLWLLNAPVVGAWFRVVLRIHGKRSAIGSNPATLILPHAIFWREGSQLKAEFRAHNKFAKRLYFAFRPLWWAIHFWDWCIADRWIPELSFNFATLTAYPDANPETTSVDGQATHDYGPGLGQTWAIIIAAVGTGAADSATTHSMPFFQSDSGTGNWKQLGRGIALFDTSSLTAAAIISAAIQSFYGSAKADALGITPDANIVSSAPASNTALATGDFDSLGAAAWCDTAVTYANWLITGYNDFAYNATGLAGISKTGITKTGIRNANYDISGTPPAWSASLVSRLVWISADTAGTTTDPKLVVTFALPSWNYYAQQ